MNQDAVIALKNKRVIFTILVHKDEPVLAAQLENILHFNPEAGIVLYNGGTDKNFAKQFNIPICPYSRPTKWAYQAHVLLDVMKWLEETNVNYEYLVSLDHDMLFINYGFERFLDNYMKDYDCMGWQLLKGSQANRFPDKRLAENMWKEWTIWKKIFGSNDFLRVFNPGQVYRRGIIKKMLKSLNFEELEELFKKTEIFGLEEMFLVTLAWTLGGRCGEYPGGAKYNEAVRWGKDITLREAHRAKKKNYYWIHPIKGQKLIRINRWLRSGAKLPKKRNKIKNSLNNNPHPLSNSVRRKRNLNQKSYYSNNSQSLNNSVRRKRNLNQRSYYSNNSQSLSNSIWRKI